MLNNIIQITLSVFIIISVLLQSSESGLGSSFGGGGGENYHTRRGLEKVLFIATIIAVILFIINSVIIVTK